MSHRNDVGCLGQDGAPHTPLPYNISSYFAPRIEGSLQTAVNEGESDKSSPKHSKRPRDGDESDQEWTAHELGLVENMLLQPSGQFPPGSLPPSTVLDDLTTRLLQSQTTMSEKSRSPGEDSITTIWLHSWDSTRQKMNEIALENSRFGIEEERRKLPREERSERPGLRRMDSMDFLDEGNAADRSTSAVGRALRLSTTLQKSAAGSTKGPEKDLPMPSIKLVPSADQRLPSPLPPKVSGRRLSAGVARPSSLLQRGRSFTAEDLQAESLQGDSPLEEERKKASENASSRDPSVVGEGDLKALTDKHNRAGITRSYSSFSVADPAPHAAQKSFLSSAVPSTDDRSLLAVPTEITKTTNSCDDESHGRRNRTAKRFKLAQKLDMSKMAPPLSTLSLLGDVGPDGLRSPFDEEKGLGR